MKDDGKSKQHLMAEMEELREKIAQLEGKEEHGAGYRTVFESTGTAMAIIEQDMTLSRVNHQFELWSGYSREEIEEKKKWTEFIVPQDLEKMQRLHIERRRQGREAPTQYEFHSLDRTGKTRDMFLTIGMIPGTKQSVASLMDLTERKRVEEDLRESERLLSQVVQGNSVPAFVINKEHALLYWNKACEKLTGISASEVIGTNGRLSIPKKGQLWLML
jgi:PAS domain S-box-containing protein